MSPSSLLTDLGSITVSSFAIVALGDLLTGLGNLLVHKLIEPIGSPWSQKVVFYWGILDDAWDEIRAFLNRVSVYSHERPAYSKGSNGKKPHT